jgi:hypothetical protein
LEEHGRLKQAADARGDGLDTAAEKTNRRQGGTRGRQVDLPVDQQKDKQERGYQAGDPG